MITIQRPPARMDQIAGYVIAPETKSIRILTNIWFLLRVLAFLGCTFFCTRQLVVFFCLQPFSKLLAGMFASLFIGAFIWKRPWYATLTYLALVPFIHGLSLMGLPGLFPWQGLLFSTLFLVWYANKILQQRQWAPDSISGLGRWADLLSLLVMVSLMLSFSAYPLRLNMHLFSTQLAALNNQTGYPLYAAQTLIQGIFLFRIIDSEAIDDRKLNRDIKIVLLIHVATILLFLVAFWLHKLLPGLLPTAVKTFYPFAGIHARGSYLVLLFFVFLTVACNPKNRQTLVFYASIAGILLVAIFMFKSKGTWLGLLITTIVWGGWIVTRRKIVLIATLLVILVSAIMGSGWWLRRLDTPIGVSTPFKLEKITTTMMRQEFLGLRDIYTRLVFWDRAIDIIQQSPLVGSGIGTYFQIAPKYGAPENRKRWHDFYENAHNYYLQFTADLGIPAVILFLLISGHVWLRGILAPKKDGTKANAFRHGFAFGLGAYMITMITGHPLLLLNQQLLFWGAVGLGARLNAADQPAHAHPIPTNPFTIVCLLAGIMILGFAFWQKFADQDMALKNESFGVYAYERGIKAHWIGPVATDRIFCKSNLFQFDVVAPSQSISSQGLQLRFSVDDTVLDEIHFSRAGKRRLAYYLPQIKDRAIRLSFEVNNAFVPYKLDMNKDLRSLSLMISPMSFIDHLPPDGIGFWKGKPHWLNRFRSAGDDHDYRIIGWTGQRATLPLPKKSHEPTVVLIRCDHPDLELNPVSVQFLDADDRLLKKKIMSGNLPVAIEIPAKDNFVTITIQRTWNPRKAGWVDGPDRDLGVLVMVPKKP